MAVRKYEKSDLNEVLGWFHVRNIEMAADYLPETGFIEPGIAAGFIYKTDANFCIFESFISNSDINGSFRHKALSEIVTAMIDESKKMGYKQAFGFATSQTMIRIGMEQEFKFVETCSTIVRTL